MAVNLHQHKGKKYFLLEHNSSGLACTVYSVAVAEIKDSLFNRFMGEHSGTGVLDIIKRLKSIGGVTGAEEDFFKFKQWAADDRICYLYAVPPDLRIYCVWFSEKMIIIGGGDQKNVEAWQDDIKLEEEACWMIQVSSDISEKIKKGDIKISEDEMKLLGTLKFNYE